MPSLMLVILCYVTLFFDLNDFNVSGLSIRSLAVGMLRTLATVLASMAIGSVETVVVKKMIGVIVIKIAAIMMIVIMMLLMRISVMVIVSTRE